jgi:hypothetical protein
VESVGEKCTRRGITQGWMATSGGAGDLAGQLYD